MTYNKFTYMIQIKAIPVSTSNSSITNKPVEQHNHPEPSSDSALPNAKNTKLL